MFEYVFRRHVFLECCLNIYGVLMCFPGILLVFEWKCLGPWGILSSSSSGASLLEGVTPVGNLRNFCFCAETGKMLGRFWSGHVRHRRGSGACSPHSASHCQLHTLCTQHAMHSNPPSLVSLPPSKKKNVSLKGENGERERERDVTHKCLIFLFFLLLRSRLSFCPWKGEVSVQFYFSQKFNVALPRLSLEPSLWKRFSSNNSLKLLYACMLCVLQKFSFLEHFQQCMYFSI